jgi:hypothetical protein
MFLGRIDMLDTKLIVLDGLSGSGKSTFCQWLELQLRRNGRSARWLHEGDIDHPLHWWDFWDGRNYWWCPSFSLMNYWQLNRF